MKIIWTKEKCIISAKEYRNRSEFQKRCSGGYKYAKRNNIMDLVCSHMTYKKMPIRKWTKEKCEEEALKYKYRSDFSNKSNGAYYSSRINGWLDDVCSHMKTNNNKPRCIYSYKFEDAVYVGLTCGLLKRKREHKNDKNSTVYKHSKNNNIIEIKQLTKYLKIYDAKKKEKFYVKLYKILGFKILNKVKTGGIGGTKTIWTKEKCKEEALKYKYRSVFKKSNESAYSASRKYDILDDVCSHMIKKIRNK